jgi:hypothetical protein
VHLVDEGAGTRLTYAVEAQVGGKLAQIGSRLIDATARKMADEFFSRFAAIVGAPVAAEPVETVAAAPVAAPVAVAPVSSAAQPATRSRLSPMVWVPALAAAVLIILYAFMRMGGSR